MIAVHGLHHLGLAVADLAASCAWSTAAGYGPPERLSVTGPDAAIGNGLAAAALEVAFVSAPRLTLEFVAFEPAADSGVGPTQRAFGAVPVWSPASPGPDPDGHPPLAGADPVPLRVTSADPHRTAALLNLLGFAGSDGGPDVVVAGHGARVEIAPVTDGRRVPANAAGRVHLCCQVADMAAAVSELADHGYAMVSSPRVHGDLSWAFVDHPEGPGVELLCVGAE